MFGVVFSHHLRINRRQAPGDLPFSGDGPEDGAEEEDEGHAQRHDAVGEGGLAAVALDVVFHIARPGQKGQAGKPEDQNACFPAVGLFIAQGEHQQHPHHRQQAENLDHADKAVAAEIQGVVPGRIQHRLGAAVVQAEEKAQVPILPAVLLPLPEKQGGQHQEEESRRYGLQQEGGQAALPGAGGGIQKDAGKQAPGGHGLATVGGIAEAGESSQAHGPATRHADGIQQRPQGSAPVEQAGKHRRQEDPKKGSNQSKSAHRVVRHGGIQAFVAVRPEIPVGQPPAQNSQHQTQRHQQEGPGAVRAVPEIEAPEEQHAHGACQSNHNGAPIDAVGANQKGDGIHSQPPEGFAVAK